MKPKKIKIAFYFGSHYFQVLAPAKREVCFRCDGTGKHVNPSIDGDGLTYDDFAEDPDFAESYMEGTFDIQCEDCNGERVVDVLDSEILESKYPRTAKAYYRHLDIQARDRAEAKWEREHC